jgi:6-phosphogluconolactonase
VKNYIRKLPAIVAAGMPLIMAAIMAAAVVLPLCAAGAKGDWIAYIGTYTRQKSKGIYAYQFAPATGKLTSIGLVAETANPSFLAVHPNGKFLYAANESNTFQGQPTGSLTAFAIDPATHQLKLLNQVSSKGSGPCHVAFDHTGKWLFTANYNSGSVAAFPVRDDGSLGEASSFVQHAGSSANLQRQRGPHAHDVTISADNRFVLVNDLGLDEILIYRLDAAKGTLTPNDPPFGKVAPGSGPRHFAFGKGGKFAYAINEITLTVTTFRYDAAKGSLTEVETLPTSPEPFTGEKSGAEIAVHPNGKFLYASNRGPNTIAVFRIDAKTGKLTPIERAPTQGKTPRNFAIDPSGNYLFAANQDSDNVVLFHLDPNSGHLTPAGNVLEVGAPVCVVFAAVK